MNAIFSTMVRMIAQSKQPQSTKRVQTIAPIFTSKRRRRRISGASKLELKCFEEDDDDDDKYDDVDVKSL